ncbi:MAG: glycoside hydrolase family 3 C-terminal domain-containing protein [Eubacterium sp.]|nr:glycoside hydrolase family 3 C-terminal domain-containing protein [Eubacterium sp.]
MDIEKMLKELTTEEKAALVSGLDFWYTNPIPRLGIPSLCMTDGPHGLRKQTAGSADGSAGESVPATAFPTAAATASGWNPENARRMGEAIADECRHYGVHVVLGPGVNIQRNPLCGRNFEYFSEDPLLASEMAIGEIEGLQSQGVGACVKHFALNNSENYRYMGNSVVSEKTMRELYLKVFERTVKKAKPVTVMCAYNQINGTYCSENKWLLTDVLRKEWGFDGLVMTDWGAIHDRVKSLQAGLDLEMPGDTAICRKRILDGIQSGALSMQDLDQAVRNVLKLVDSFVQDPLPDEPDFDSHHELAAELAADCAVLMKNDGLLPLTGKEKLHICGPMFEQMRYQGAGSSMIHAARLTSPADVFQAKGIRQYSVEECDTIILFAGLTDDYESEGCDRENMKLPDDQLQLIERMCAAGKPVVVVLFGGSPVELPFNDQVGAILNMVLPGQNGGTAVYRLLFGEVNPSGKLAQTWPLRYEDVPGQESFGKGVNEVYREGTEAGYRYYNAHGIPVRYGFGHGLSYTTFRHTEWMEKDGVYTQEITNTGSRFGGETAQLWLDGELAGFRKVYLQPGETIRVALTPEVKQQTAYSDELTVPAEPPVLPITLDSRFTNLRRTFIGRILYRVVMQRAEREMKEARKLPEGAERDNKIKGAVFTRRILESNSLNSMTMCAGETFPYNYAVGFAEMANGHLLKGIKAFLQSVQVPPLPKDKNKNRDVAQ